MISPRQSSDPPYHACVSWTYVGPERAEEALLRIRRELKLAAGWWTDAEETQFQATLNPKEG